MAEVVHDKKSFRKMQEEKIHAENFAARCSVEHGCRDILAEKNLTGNLHGNFPGNEVPVSRAAPVAQGFGSKSYWA
ncbi:MAG: hypothetical protein EPO03_00690 [Porticoccaceae bacterium]|nr:MAG: hypothetical protein EPO03_00690 [Porticoccaceae bacterium]